MVTRKAPSQRDLSHSNNVAPKIQHHAQTAAPTQPQANKTTSKLKPCPTSVKRQEESVNHGTSGSTGNPIAPSYGLVIKSKAIVCVERMSLADMLAATSSEGADHINRSNTGSYIGFFLFTTICTCSHTAYTTLNRTPWNRHHHQVPSGKRYIRRRPNRQPRKHNRCSHQGRHHDSL